MENKLQSSFKSRIDVPGFTDRKDKHLPPLQKKMMKCRIRETMCLPGSVLAPSGVSRGQSHVSTALTHVMQLGPGVRTEEREIPDAEDR